MPQITKRTAENLSSLNRKARAKIEPFFLEAAAEMERQGVLVEVISGYRDGKAQARLYAMGRTTPGRKGGFGPADIVTKAKPWSSWHNYGLAVDFGLFKNGVYLDEKQPLLADRLYKVISVIAARYGIEWAGKWKSFTENCHFQWTNGLAKTAEAKARLDQVGGDIQKLF